VEARLAIKRSTALRAVRALKCPSIDINDVDEAVDEYLIAHINDLWPRPANEEDEVDLIEALRTDLRVAITQVLADSRVKVV
jgi:hypothetical protein